MIELSIKTKIGGGILFIKSKTNGVNTILNAGSKHIKKVKISILHVGSLILIEENVDLS
jgi:hypothetical protein